MSVDTKAIRRRADACFRGPWTHTSFAVECNKHDYEDCDGDGQHDIVRISSPDEYPGDQVIADVPGLEMFAKAHSEFIASARTDVPALCDRVEALEAALEVIGGRLLGEPCSREQLLADVRAALEGR